MSRLRFYQYTTLLLLLVNVCLIGFFLFHKPPPPGSHGPGKQKAVDLLKMNEEQHTVFLNSADKHIERIKQLDDQQRKWLEDYFRQLIKPIKEEDAQNILDQVQSLEQAKIEYTLEHLQEVKSLLEPEQYADFERFMTHVFETILVEEKKNPRPPKDF